MNVHKNYLSTRKAFLFLVQINFSIILKTYFTTGPYLSAKLSRKMVKFKRQTPIVAKSPNFNFWSLAPTKKSHFYFTNFVPLPHPLASSLAKATVLWNHLNRTTILEPFQSTLSAYLKDLDIKSQCNSP